MFVGAQKSVNHSVLSMCQLWLPKTEAAQCKQISSRCSQDNMTGLVNAAGPGSFRAFVDASEIDGLCASK
jgi:short-subunit dehydrogenase